MRRGLLLLGCLASCGGIEARPAPDAAAPEPDAAADEPFAGGSILLPACGYAVTTRAGATAPRLISSSAATYGPDPTPRQIHLGIAGDPARSMVVLWRTADDATTATTVRYGKASVDEAVQDGLSFSYQALGGPAQPRMHEVHLCGLAPDTEYRYQVGGGAAWSPVHVFRTAPDASDPSAQVTIGVLGDTRGGQDVWGGAVAKLVDIGAPDLLLFTGDAVTLGSLQAEWDLFFDRARDALARTPILFAHGNHELNAAPYYAQAAMPGNESWYALDYGPAHLTVLNDTPEDDAQLAGVERAFLADDLAASAAAPWRLVMHHKSMWSSSLHGGDATVSAAWGPVIAQQRVDLVLSGHDHDYERTRPLYAGQVVPDGQGTVYVVTGSAGAPLYQSGTSWFTATSESVENFVVLSLRRGRLDARAYRADGTLMDSFALSK